VGTAEAKEAEVQAAVEVARAAVEMVAGGKAAAEMESPRGPRC
jgi:signal transduction histidine kinase